MSREPKQLSAIIRSITLLILLLAIYAYAEDRRLTMQCNPVDIDKMEWDFSSSEKADVYPFYRSYGDTLVAEFHEGRRQWYEIKNNNAYYLGEETRLFKVMLDYPVATTAFSKTNSESSDSCQGMGRYCRTVDFGMTGTYESYFPVYGRIVMAHGVIIAVKAVTEKRVSESKLLCDSLPAGNVQTREDITTRWFVEDALLPVAMQRSSSVMENDKTVSSETVTYIMDADEVFGSHNIPDNALQKALENAVVEIGSGCVTINGDFPENTTLAFTITDISGMMCHQEYAEAGSKSEIIRFQLPTLPHGQYLLTISVGSSNDRKMMINL